MADVSLRTRLDRIPWTAVETELAQQPYARLGLLLTPIECRQLISLYAAKASFRSCIDMERHRFGVGEYKYFAHPLPGLVEELRGAAYPHLARMANGWAQALGAASRFPESLEQFLSRCHDAGQRRPTPLLLRYETGGYNALHQDLYGEVAFPLQLAVFLSQPERDYTGGEFLLVEQRPRAQSIGEALLLGEGEAVVFANRHRPVRSARGYYRAAVRHGVSRVRSGQRFTLGVIFHDAL